MALWFLGIPIGIFGLFRTFRLIRKRFKGKVILEVPLSEVQSSFKLHREGVYAIWHKGDLFRRTPVKRLRPKVFQHGSGQQVRLFPSLMRPNMNNGITGRMELFTFSAKKGTYQLKLAEGSSISQIEAMLTSGFPAKGLDKDRYVIQIRESQAFYLFLLAVFLIWLSIACIVVGLVMGMLTV